jgi:diamine N-acetyltransferase
MISSHTLRDGAPGDEHALSLVGAASFLEAFAGTIEGPDILAHCRYQHAPEKYAAWLAASDSRLCLAEVKHAPVGYALLTPPDLPIPTKADDIELKRIYLLHRFQSLGIGAELMDWSITTARSLGKRRLLLGVYAKNELAIAFYRRQHFTPAGTREFTIGTTTFFDYLFAREI